MNNWVNISTISLNTIYFNLLIVIKINPVVAQLLDQNAQNVNKSIFLFTSFFFNLSSFNRRPPSLSELTPTVFNMELIHLGSEVSNYQSGERFSLIYYNLLKSWTYDVQKKSLYQITYVYMEASKPKWVNANYF